MLYALSYGCPAPVKPPELYHPTAGELISDVRVRFEAAGLSLSNDEAVNLLACLTLNGITLVSGPTGSGKSDTVRALAAALGLSGTGRFVEMTAGEDWQHLGRQISGPSENGMPLTHLPEARRLFRTCDRLTPTLLLIDDANRAPIERYLDELMGLNEPGSPRQLTTGCEPLPIHPQLRLMMTVADAPNGCPLTAKLLDRAFTIRLCPPGADLTWPAEPIQMPSVDRAVSLEALARAFDPNRELPGEIAHRLDELRRQLAVLGVRLSRRALVDMHRYLSAVLPMMQSDSMAALDLAIAQRALPAILASADLRALHELPDLMADLPHCLNLMRQPLALPPV
jgi:MoxR-like ATPase